MKVASVKYTNREIGERIKERMNDIPSDYYAGHITSEELAIKCGMPKSSVNSIIYLGRAIKDDELRALAANLFVSVDYLLTGEGYVYPHPPVLSATDMLLKNILVYFTTVKSKL